MEKRESKRPSHFPSAVAGMAMGAVAPFLGGCGASDSQLPAAAEMSSSSNPQVAAVEGKCEAGAVRHCKVIRAEFQGIQSCFDGAQMCFDGAWSPCGDPADVLPPGVVMPAAAPAK